MITQHECFGKNLYGIGMTECRTENPLIVMVGGFFFWVRERGRRNGEATIGAEAAESAIVRMRCGIVTFVVTFVFVYTVFILAYFK